LKIFARLIVAFGGTYLEIGMVFGKSESGQNNSFLVSARFSLSFNPPALLVDFAYSRLPV
jgi:hypothetical protein